MRRAYTSVAIALAACASFTVPVDSARGASRPLTPPTIAAVKAPRPLTATKTVALDSLVKLDDAWRTIDNAKAAPEWVNQKPPRFTQTEKSVRARGINPCLTPDPGFGPYTKWDRSTIVGQMIIPKDGIAESGDFDVMIHFHGHEAARKEWVQAIKGPVLVGIDLGNGSGAYEDHFTSARAFGDLLESIEKGVAKRTGNGSAHIRRIGLSAWSAGYGAIQEILRFREQRDSIDSVILLDGLHSGFNEQLRSAQLAPFVQFAREAVRRHKLMFVSHSSIIPPTYASTTETSNYLVWKVGGEPTPSRPRPGDPMGLELISRFSQGNFFVRGYAGNAALDHCAQVGLYRDVLKTHVGPRWHATSL